MKLVKKDEIIATEGEYDNKVFILIKGALAVYKGEVEVSRFYEKGTILGEMSMILQSPRTATIKAIEDSYVEIISGDLTKLIQNFPEITRNILVNIAERLMHTTENYFMISEKLHNLNKNKKILEEIKSREERVKTFTDYMWFKTAKDNEIIDITKNVVNIVAQSGVTEGLLNITALDSESSVILSKDEKECYDILDEFNRSFKFQNIQEEKKETINHFRNLLIGNSINLPVTKCKMELTPDQNIYYIDFNGKKRKRVIIKILGS